MFKDHVANHGNSMTKIYALVNVLGEWVVEAKPPTFTNDSLFGPIASFVLDPMTGNELATSATALQAAMQEPTDQGKGKEVSVHCLWVAASKKSIRCAINFSGERIAKVELEDEGLSNVFYVTRHGEFDEGLSSHDLQGFRSQDHHCCDDYRLRTSLHCPLPPIYHPYEPFLWTSRTFQWQIIHRRLFR